MATLNLFPARIRFTNTDGTLTPEAYRALQVLFERVGGALGDNGTDTFGDLTGVASLDLSLTDTVTQPISEQALTDMVQQPASVAAFVPDVVQSLVCSASFVPDVVQPVNEAAKAPNMTANVVGIGVIPGPWFFASKAIDNEAGSLSSYGVSVQHLSQNAYLNASSVWTYKNNGAAVRYEQGAGASSWYSASPGLAGDSISFATVMVLNATGDLSNAGSHTIGLFTSATRPAHAAGKLIYVTDGGAGANFQGSNGSAWVNLG